MTFLLIVSCQIVRFLFPPSLGQCLALLARPLSPKLCYFLLNFSGVWIKMFTFAPF